LLQLQFLHYQLWGQGFEFFGAREGQLLPLGGGLSLGRLIQIADLFVLPSILSPPQHLCIYIDDGNKIEYAAAMDNKTRIFTK
jgi:hypothetical protein